MELSRPLEDGVARFRLVQIDGTPSLFVCEHLTPELVWRPQWQSHANGATELARVALAAKEPFAGLPASIEWDRAPALYIRGLRRASKAHGVHFVPA
jgi:hypothetical protein